jgi:hypothetical protein
VRGAPGGILSDPLKLDLAGLSDRYKPTAMNASAQIGDG